MSTLAPITLADVLPAHPVVDAGAALIGVVIPLNYPDLTEETRELVVRFTRSTLQTLTDLGARLVVIDPTAETPDPIDGIDGIDGLVLLGGGDVDPTLYGHHDDVPSLNGVDRRCDERTLDAIRQAVARQLPLFGICRGAQMLNVAHGGDLIPDLGPDTPHHGHGEDPLFVDDTVLIEPDTRLSAILNATTATVRNGHHQAVGTVAPALRVAARGVDGVVEAVEHRDPAIWLLGVQWHPEDTDGPAADRHALFSAFLARVESDRKTAIDQH